MTESRKRYYTKEEEFLDEFHMVAYAAAELMGEDWHPAPSCNDNMRKQTKYFLSTGELTSLVFDSAAVYHDDSGFSSAQITLKSSKRLVTVRVRRMDGKLVAEKLLDKLVTDG
jgi:hypothetical protein